MATQHSISDLLTAGAEPTQDEARYLSDLGRFTAALFARYLSGLSGERGDAGSRHAAMVAALEGRLAHRGAGQWMAGMGLGAAQLADGWHGLWQMSAGVPEGYQRLDVSAMEVFQLLPDAIVSPYREAETRAVPRRASLFGPRSHAPARRSPSSAPKGPLPSSTRLAMREGGEVSVGALEALAQGGLPLADQLDLRRLGEVAGPGPLEQANAPAGARSSGRDATAARRRPPGGRTASAGRRPGPVRFDGVEVDARTPALAGALSWAEQAFGRSLDRHAGLSVTRVGTERLLQGPARTMLDAGRGEARPVFGFFDSVEGEFLSLEREAQPQGAAETSAPRRSDALPPGARPLPPGGRMLQRDAVDRVAASSPSDAGRARILAGSAAARDASPVTTTRLSTVAPGPGGSAPVIRPESRGVFSNPSAQLRPARGPLSRAGHHRPVAGMVATFEPGAIDRATTALFADDVVYDGAGRPRARESRGALASPRIMLRPDNGSPGPVGTRGAPVMPHLGYQAVSAIGGPVVGFGVDSITDTARAGVGAPLDSGARGTRVDRSVEPALGLDLAAMGLSTGRTAGAATWRLADDLGRDLPLGATLSSYERLAGGLVDESAAFIGRGEPFRPVVATAHAGAGRKRGSGSVGWAGYADSLDGVAWVALEQDGPATGSAEPALAMIPTGRRAVMVPASGALALNASVEARRATEARGRIEARRSASTPRSLVGPRGAQESAAADTTGLGSAPGASGAQPSLGRLAGSARALVASAGAASDRVRQGHLAPVSRMQRGSLLPTGTLLQDARTGRPLGMRSAGELTARFAGEPAAAAQRASAVEPPAQATSTAAVFAAPAQGRISRTARRGFGARAPAASADWRVGARVARRALQRPGVTGREWLATQALIGAEGPLVAGATAAASRRSVVEPSLLADLDSRAAFASILGGVLPADGGALLGRLASLAPGDAVRVGRALRAAGWAEPELAMLDLTSELGDARLGGGSAAAADPRISPGGQGARAERRQPPDGPRQARAVGPAAGGGRAVDNLDRALAGATRGSGEPLAARGEAARPVTAGLGVGGGRGNRMARNLARILTGTASLGGGVSAGGGGAPSLSVDSLLGGALGVLGPRGAALDYFAGLAPARGGESARRGTLRDAIGELLAVARAELASGRALEPALRASIGHQVSRLDSAWRAGFATPASSNRHTGGPTSEVAAGPATSGAGAVAPTRGRAWHEAIGGGPDRKGAAPAWAGARAGGYQETDRPLVVPQGDALGDTLADRLASAIGQSSRGPAGVGRLTRAVVGAAGAPTAAASGGEQFAPALAASKGAERDGAGSPGPRRSARSFERRALGESVALSSVLAPEAMLGGLWSSVAGEASSGPWRGELAGELTKIEQTPEPRAFDGISRQGESADKARAVGSSPMGLPVGAALGAVPGGAVEARPGATRRRGGAPREGGRRELIVGRITRILEHAGVRSEAAQELLVDSLARNVGRGRQLVAREHGAMAEFSWAWLGRVDGSRSGLDLELQGDREAFARAFSGMRGPRGSSAERTPGLARFSSIDEAGFVMPQSGAAPGASPGEDRSGVRRVARASGIGRSGASRPSHRAAEAAKQTNWRFVDTGSRASSAHADLGRLAATVLDSPDVGRRVPMPLVMPAVKAVAQSALREDASARGANVDDAKQRADQQAQQSQNAADAKAGAQLSDEALEGLAYELADRIARRMKREQERRGLCR